MRVYLSFRQLRQLQFPFINSILLINHFSVFKNKGKFIS